MFSIFFKKLSINKSLLWTYVHSNFSIFKKSQHFCMLSKLILMNRKLTKLEIKRDRKMEFTNTKLLVKLIFFYKSYYVNPCPRSIVNWKENKIIRKLKLEIK